ncbi:MAG: hypothetical protein II891_07070 [Bacteroidales bacterium]|nr:hypothetical protein [Bacteroidales bacterium]
MSRTVLITGPIGSGKSALCRHLENLGYPVYECDARTKALYDEIPGLKARIESALGVPFSEIGIVFKDAAKLRVLEEIVYPEVLADLAAWKAAQTAPLLFMESAIALQKPAFDGTYDEVWLLRAPYQTRLERNPAVLLRDPLQGGFDSPLIRHIIENDSTLEALYDKTDKIIHNGYTEN